MGHGAAGVFAFLDPFKNTVRLTAIGSNGPNIGYLRVLTLDEIADDGFQFPRFYDGLGDAASPNVPPLVEEADTNDLQDGASSGPPPSFRRGDSNGDGKVDLSDATTILAYLFVGDDTPHCMEAANANGDTIVDLSDATTVMSYLFLGDTHIPRPRPETCGVSSTAVSECLQDSAGD